MSSSDSPKAHSFNFIHFMQFLSNNNVLATAIAAVLSDRISDLTNSVVDNIIMAIVNRDADNDGKADVKSLENKEIIIFNIRFKYGKVLMALIRFIIITYVIFVISMIIKRFESKHKF